MEEATTSSDLPALKSQAVGAAVEADWLVNLQISVAREGADDDPEEKDRTDQANAAAAAEPQTLCILQPPDVQVEDVRTIIRDMKQIPHKEQRLYDANTGAPVLHGAIPAPSPDGIVALSLRRVPLDARLEALFEMVCMGDAAERSELMGTMMKARRAGECYGGSGHSPLERLEGSDDDLDAYFCAICYFRKLPEEEGEASAWVGNAPQELFVCRLCSFALCTRCRTNDKGWVPPADPYLALTDLAISLGKRMASIGCWFGGKGHFCGHPRVQCRTGIAPRAYQCNDEQDKNSRRRGWHENGVVMTRQKQVLHCGIRLKIQLDETVREVFVDQGKDYSEIELDKVLPDGATISDVITYRSVLEESALWPFVAESLESKFSYYRTRDGDQAKAYPTTKLLSYGIEEAVFELGANIDDGDY